MCRNYGEMRIFQLFKFGCKTQTGNYPGAQSKPSTLFTVYSEGSKMFT